MESKWFTMARRHFPHSATHPAPHQGAGSIMRRLLASPDFRAGFVEMLPACLGLIPFGLVCGVGAAAAGASWLAALGMSAVIFSGAAQILAGQMLAGGAPFAIIVLTCSVLGLRFLMYSAAMAPYLKALPARWQHALAFLLTDQAFASAIRRFDAKDDPHGGAQHFLGCGVALYLCWQITSMVGYFAGNLIPASWSLEFAVPLCFIALVAPLLRDAPTILSAIVAGYAVVALGGLPMKLNLIAAGVIGIAVGTIADLARERWTRR
jgi:predicted branched-subunit amino acid permease